METSLTGMILVWAGIGASLFRPAWLPKMVVFSLPFSAVAVINFLQPGGYSGLQLPMFYGLLWLLSRGTDFFLRQEVGLPARDGIPKSFILLAAFCLAALGSMLMPFLISEPFVIRHAHNITVRYGFGMRNISQYIYLLYGVALAWIVYGTFDGKRELKTCIRVWAASALAMALWGLYQFLCYEMGIPYPAEWIHTNLSAAAQGYKTTMNLAGSIYRRISSAATEPSIYAQAMLVILPWFLSARLFRITIWNEWLDSFTAGILIVTLLLSTAASAYAGLVWIGLLLAIWLVWQGKGRKVAGYLTLLILTVSGAYLFFPTLQYLISSGVIHKLSSGSGMERMDTVKQAAGFFLKYPLLGLGWGSLTAHDLFFNILGNTGLAGGLTFWSFALLVSHQSIQRIRLAAQENADPEDEWIATAGAASFFMLLFLNLLTGFMYTYGHFWFVIGLAVRIGEGPGFIARHERTQ